MPFIYYGDETGMNFLDVPTKEGGYTRTGTRTPMQWDHSDNLGFSQAPADQLYLPVDPSQQAPTVADQIDAPDSMFSWTKVLLSLRARRKSLQANGGFKVIAAPADGRSFAYLRSSSDNGEQTLVLMNPGGREETLTSEIAISSIHDEHRLACLGQVHADRGQMVLGPQSFAVLSL